MIYLPWIVFIIGTALIIWRSVRTRREYIRRSADALDKYAYRKVYEDGRLSVDESFDEIRKRARS